MSRHIQVYPGLTRKNLCKINDSLYEYVEVEKGLIFGVIFSSACDDSQPFI